MSVTMDSVPISCDLVDGVEVEVLEYPILRRKYFNLKGIINYGFSYLATSRKLKKIIKRIKFEKNIQRKIKIIYLNQNPRLRQ